MPYIEKRNGKFIGHVKIRNVCGVSKTLRLAKTFKVKRAAKLWAEALGDDIRKLSKEMRRVIEWYTE